MARPRAAKRWSGARLRKARTKAGITQETLAYNVGVTGATVSSHESESTIPDANVLCRYGWFFARPVEFFLVKGVRSAQQGAKPCRKLVEKGNGLL